MSRHGHTDSPVFRRYELRDAAGVQRLHREALESVSSYIAVPGYYADLDDIPGTYIEPGGEFLVGEVDGDVVAMGGIMRLSDTVAELRRLRVAPRLQGWGIGRRLLSALEAEAIARGVSVIELDTTLNQAPAQRLFVSAGYGEVRRGGKGGHLESIFYRKAIHPEAANRDR